MIKQINKEGGSPTLTRSHPRTGERGRVPPLSSSAAPSYKYLQRDCSWRSLFPDRSAALPHTAALFFLIAPMRCRTLLLSFPPAGRCCSAATFPAHILDLWPHAAAAAARPSSGQKPEKGRQGGHHDSPLIFLLLPISLIMFIFLLG